MKKYISIVLLAFAVSACSKVWREEFRVDPSCTFWGVKVYVPKKLSVSKFSISQERAEGSGIGIHYTLQHIDAEWIEVSVDSLPKLRVPYNTVIHIYSDGSMTLTEPNKAPEPTTMSVTDRACARSAPDTVVAQL